MMAQHEATGFRDLNKNGRLDPYEDPNQPIETRIDNVLSQMTLPEKAGMLFQSMAPLGFADMPTGKELIEQKLMNHFNVVGSGTAREMAEWHNALQRAAEGTRLGIPVTISSDPRHAFTNNPGAGFAAGAFSEWPEPLGLAATRDAALVEEFADIARQEYLAAGIRLALHPVADLATEPRWARITGTFGEDADLAAELTAAYIRGFQGPELGPHSVACMIKHFPGGGPQKDGEDPHFIYGQEQSYPGDNFEYHLKPFEAAFAAGTAQIMPYYGVPIGIGLEEVGFGFNRQVVTGMLREQYGFEGVVCTDWGLLTDGLIQGKPLEARAWGVEHLSLHERAKKVLDAGCDQFGGERCPEVIVELVESGQVPETRIDASVRRLLRDKFRLGLFDNPYVDPDAAERIIGNPAFRVAGERAQRASIVLLKNSLAKGSALLPLSCQPALYIEGMKPEAAGAYGHVVEEPAAADLAILRLAAPYEPRNQRGLEDFFHAGSLAFTEDELSRMLAITRTVPTIVDIYLDRPAVIPEIAGSCIALLANFGANDTALLDILFGRQSPTGRLPFELPSSMDAVRNQKPDLPYDSEHPLFPYGFGLEYGG